MIIKKITIKGEGKVDASLDFEKGLNIVCGASDTGKSYVVQCLKFIFGASETPKKIKAANGYSKLEVTFEKENGDRFSLQRDLSQNSDSVLIETLVDGSQKITILKGKHKTGLKNLSNWFLSNFGLNDKILLKGKESLNTQSLSIRTLEKIFLVDETRIISDKSPLGTGQNGEKTLEKSFLKTLLTGVDDSKAKRLKIDASSKEVLETKIASLEELIEKLYPYSEESKQRKEIIDKELDNLEETLEKAEYSLNISISLNKDVIDSRDKIVKEMTATQSKKREELMLLERFNLLKTKYESDKERLLGIGEAALFLDSYIQSACPTCGQDFDDVASDEEIKQMAISTKAELKKIDNQLLDLGGAINDLEVSVGISNRDIKKLELELDSYNSLIEPNIKEKLNEANRIKSEIATKKPEFLTEQFKLDARNSALTELGYLKIKMDSPQAFYDFDSFDTELNALASEVEKIFMRWSYPDYDPTRFDLSERDIVIGNQPRSHFGKGYRAVACSAFIIGLMVTLSKSGRHPGVVILDSPLTAYKKADPYKVMEDETEEEELSENLIYGFFCDLCDYYGEHQIIVFDNQEPDKALIPKMNYEHFSKNKTLGRYGFFPDVDV